MARVAGREQSPYDMMLAGLGLQAPPRGYVRSSDTGGLTPAPPTNFINPATATYLGLVTGRGGATYNPNYWRSSLGQAELRQRGQIAAETQLRDLQSEIERQGQISQTGSHVFSDAELDQRRDILNAGSTAASALAPFVSSGLVGAQGVREQIGAAVSDSFNESRMVRNAAKDVQLLTERANTSQYDLRQITSVRNELVNKYGERVLMRVPGWRQIAGADGLYQQQVQEARAAKAQSWGLPVDSTRWDERSGRAVADEEWFAINKMRTDTATKQSDIARREAKLLFDTEISAANKQYQSQLKEKVDPETAFHNYNKWAAAALDRYNTAVNPQPAQSQNLPPAQANAAERLAKVREQAAATFGKYPKLPKGARFMGEVTDVGAARRSTPLNSYVAINGQLVYRNAGGKFTAVQ